MEKELELDYSERAGFMVGKSAAIAEWQFRKETKAFEKKVAALRATKWNREHPERAKATGRRWWKRHLAEVLPRRRVRNRKAPRSRACDVCHERYELPYPHPRGKVRTICSPKCKRIKLNQQAREHQARKRAKAG